ncbi:hypothetical protein HDU93_005668 [Gonapodya sp. JEL0774]|nr:hypothetical protein HDU93_005668 [Gonapodya sp. JEL0774]
MAPAPVKTGNPFGRVTQTKHFKIDGPVVRIQPSRIVETGAPVVRVQPTKAVKASCPTFAIKQPPTSPPTPKHNTDLVVEIPSPPTGFKARLPRLVSMVPARGNNVHNVVDQGESLQVLDDVGILDIGANIDQGKSLQNLNVDADPEVRLPDITMDDNEELTDSERNFGTKLGYYYRPVL